MKLLAAPCNMWELISLTRNWTHALLQWKCRVLTIGPPGTFPQDFAFLMWLGFPRGPDGKESACNAGDPGSIPKSGRSPGEGNGHPLQYSCPENPMDRVAWRATVHGVTKNQAWLSMPCHSRGLNWDNWCQKKQTPGMGVGGQVTCWQRGPQPQWLKENCWFLACGKHNFCDS